MEGVSLCLTPSLPSCIEDGMPVCLGHPVALQNAHTPAAAAAQAALRNASGQYLAQKVPAASGAIGGHALVY